MFFTRLFGTRVEGEALRSLLSAMGYPDPVLTTRLEKWGTTNVYGKCSARQTEEGLNVDLYVYRTDAHLIDGSIGLDQDYYNGKVLSGCNVRDGVIEQRQVVHYNGLILK